MIFIDDEYERMRMTRACVTYYIERERECTRIYISVLSTITNSLLALLLLLLSSIPQRPHSHPLAPTHVPG